MPFGKIPILVFVFLFGFPTSAWRAAATPCAGLAGQNQDSSPQIAAKENGRNREANAALPPPKAGENRVVFFGDSITARWRLPAYFSGKPYVNRGISGETTPQMLARFPQDVIDLHPEVVVVLAGINDIAHNAGAARNEDIEANYASMAGLARANGVRVVFSSVLPVHSYTEKAKNSVPRHSPARILALNEWLTDYCNKNGIVYLDYFRAMVDDKGWLKRELSDDGLHPNAAGYKVMAPLAEAAIAAATKEGSRSTQN
jgi:lysophospholipase L1-like esterase